MIVIAMATTSRTAGGRVEKQTWRCCDIGFSRKLVWRPTVMNWSTFYHCRQLVCGTATLQVLLKSLKVLLGRVTPQMMFGKRALSPTHCCSSGLVSAESDLRRFRVSFLGVGKKNKTKRKNQQQQQRTVTLILSRLTCYAHHISAVCSIGALCNMSRPHSKRVLLPMTNLRRLLL